jgi:hypothetical protein
VTKTQTGRLKLGSFPEDRFYVHRASKCPCRAGTSRCSQVLTELKELESF